MIVRLRLIFLLLSAVVHNTCVAADFSKLFEIVDPAVVILNTFSENPDPENPAKVVKDKVLVQAS